MSKKEEQERKNARLLAQPTSYTFDLADIDAEQYASVLREVFMDKAYIELAKKRERLFKSVSGLRVGTPALTGVTRQIEGIDRKMADIIYSQLVMKNLSEREVNEVIPFNQLLRYYVDYNQEGMLEHVTRLSNNLDKVIFLADVMDYVLTDVKSDMEAVFHGEVQFKQFDVVANAMKQMGRFFGTVLTGDPDSPTAQLFMEYSDSINAYVDKRMKTYNEKHRRLSPIHQVYGEDDMVRAINQFFGVEKKFGYQFIKHTRAGGCYIDAMKLIPNLNPIETEKLNKAVGETVTYSNMDKYDLRVTDVILGAYQPYN